mmetsp:Transcript_1961/g.2001  ORF Transcript_1961/g.2001 Transcript_1961/m.2001 type:complete len:208 (+) Transcript_1961:66-689(+)
MLNSFSMHGFSYNYENQSAVFFLFLTCWLRLHPSALLISFFLAMLLIFAALICFIFELVFSISNLWRGRQSVCRLSSPKSQPLFTTSVIPAVILFSLTCWLKLFPNAFLISFCLVILLSLAALASFILDLNFSVSNLWHGRQSVCKLSRPQSPPPSTTAMIWSACQKSPSFGFCNRRSNDDEVCGSFQLLFKSAFNLSDGSSDFILR